MPSQRVIEGWLLSGDSRLVAWGAHDTLASQDKALVPTLLSLAAQWRALPPMSDQHDQENQQDRQDQRDAMAAVVDTLIQMKAPVPADTLRLLAPEFGNAVAVLLSRMPPEKSGALAFDFYKARPLQQYGLQYVSASLLALHPVPGFAADLVANTPVEANVFVIAPGAEQLGTGVMSECCSGFLTTPRTDWPMTGQYALTTRKWSDSVLLVGGVNPIYTSRQLSTRYQSEQICGKESAILKPEARLRLTAEMLGVAPDALGWRSEPETNIEFRSLPQFQAQLLFFVAGEQAKYRATLAMLADRHLVAPDEAEQSLPEIDLRVHDLRGADADPALKPGTLPPHVTWSTAPF